MKQGIKREVARYINVLNVYCICPICPSFISLN